MLLPSLQYTRKPEFIFRRSLNLFLDVWISRLYKWVNKASNDTCIMFLYYKITYILRVSTSILSKNHYYISLLTTKSILKIIKTKKRTYLHHINVGIWVASSLKPVFCQSETCSSNIWFRAVILDSPMHCFTDNRRMLWKLDF